MSGGTNLFRMIYLSQNKIVGDARAVDIEIARILATCRRNNAAVGVTGALMFTGTTFLQTLEGGEAELESVYERISRDTRHSDPQILEWGPADTRYFVDWSMAYTGDVAGDRARFEAVLLESDTPTSGLMLDMLRAGLAPA
jgi:hypothetical protein